MKRYQNIVRNSKFLSNTSWIVIGQLANMLISFIIGVLTVRYLGPTDYGVLNYIYSYIAFFSSLTGLGLNGVIIYEFVKNHNEEGEILGTAIILRLIVGLISSLSFLALVRFTDGSDSKIMNVAILQSIQLPFTALNTVNFWYQSKLMSKHSVIIQLISFVLMSIYRIFLLLYHKGVEWFAFATTLDVIIVGLLFIFSYFHHSQQKLRVSKIIAKRILKSCLPFIFANIMVIIYGQIDKIMIKFLLRSMDEVGLYSSALTICGTIGFLPSAILDSARPVLIESKGISESLYQIRTRQLFAAIFWICLIYSILICLFAKSIILLLFGKEYIASLNCLRIAVWYTAFSYLGGARSVWLICENKNKYVALFSFMGAITNVFLNYILIPMWGIEGAALATLLTQILSNLIYPSFLKTTRQYSRYAIDAILLRNIQLHQIAKLLRIRIIK